MAYTSYDRIGEGYDRTRQADPYLTERIFELLGSPVSGEFLDIGCGTGNYSVALAERGPRITGIDPSAKMLERAASKSNRVTWVAGSVEELPFASQQFDGATAILTTHHWSDLALGFREIARVVRPASPFVLFTSTPEQMQRYWLCHYFPKMMERSCSVMYTAKHYSMALQHAGFHSIEEVSYSVRPDLKDQFLYSSKDSPERYLDPAFRAGISSFKALCDPEELAAGLAALEADIRSGRWTEIRSRYQHESGDYLFLASRRT